MEDFREASLGPFIILTSTFTLLFVNGRKREITVKMFLYVKRQI